MPTSTLATMRRLKVAGLVLIAALLCAPAAAQVPRPTVSTSYGTVTPSYVSGTMTPRGGGGPTLIADGFGLNQPTLLADPGSIVTIKLAGPVDLIRIWLGQAQLPVVPAGAWTYTVSVPADASLPAKFGIGTESSTDQWLMTDSWILNLGGDIPDTVPPQPTPTPTPTPWVLPTARPEPIAKVGARVRLTGKRLRVTVACPAEAPKACAGALTLKTASIRVVRLPFAGIPGGSSATLTTTVRAAAVRHIKRHRVRTLRVVVTAASGTTSATYVKLG